MQSLQLTLYFCQNSVDSIDVGLSLGYLFYSFDICVYCLVNNTMSSLLCFIVSVKIRQRVLQLCSFSDCFCFFNFLCSSHIHFRISLSISIKKFDRVLEIRLGKTAIFIWSPPICEHGVVFHLVLSSLIASNSILQFSECKCCTYFVRIIPKDFIIRCYCNWLGFPNLKFQLFISDIQEKIDFIHIL